MLQTFSRPAAGEQLSAAEMRRLFETVEALTRIQGVPPLRFTWDVAGPRVSTDEPRSIWVRITGKESSGSGGSGSGDGGESAYSGIEQTTLDELEGTQDLEGGLEFFVDNLYLKEVTGNPDVPYDAIVRAYSTQDGPYYTFLYSPGTQVDSGSGSGSGCGGDNCGIRISDLIRCVDGQMFDGCLVIRNGCLTLIDDDGTVVAGGGPPHDEEHDPLPPPP